LGERRLAPAGWAGDPDLLAVVDPEVEIVQGR
jgi:hypothetical protein